MLAPDGGGGGEQVPEVVVKRKIGEFCRRWKVVDFSLFGSVLREDFRPDSDVDELVTFAPNAQVS